MLHRFAFLVVSLRLFHPFLAGRRGQLHRGFNALDDRLLKWKPVHFDG